MKENTGKIIAAVILGVAVLGIVSVVAIFGGFIMHFFGFEYTSVWSIVLFFFAAMIIAYPIEIVAAALPKVLHHGFHKITLIQAKVLYLVLDTMATAIGLLIVDAVMKSVEASDSAILVVSILIAFFGVKDIGKEERDL